MRQRPEPLPSYRNGFANSQEESLLPTLWRGFAAGCAPFLGIAGRLVPPLKCLAGCTVSLETTGSVYPSWLATAEGPAVAVATTSHNYLQFGDKAVLKFTGAHTLAWWGYLLDNGTTTAGGVLLSRLGAPPNRTSQMAWYNDAIFFGAAPDGYHYASFSTATLTRSYPSPDLIVVAYVPGQRITAYQNGVQVGQFTSGIPSPFFNASAFPWQIGMRGDLAYDPTNCQTLFAGLWNRELTAAEVSLWAKNPKAMLMLRRSIVGVGSQCPDSCIDEEAYGAAL